MSQLVPDVNNEAASTNVSNKDNCETFLRSLPGGDRALEHAIKQAQYCSRTQVDLLLPCLNVLKALTHAHQRMTEIACAGK